MPSSRRWNLVRHIRLCHKGIGECLSNWDFPVGGSRPKLNKQAQTPTPNRNEKFYHSVPFEKTNPFPFSRNESSHTNPEPDFNYIMTVEFAKERARVAARNSMYQAGQGGLSFPLSSNINHTEHQVDPDAEAKDATEIFGFRGYACDKCLKVETLFVAFVAEGLKFCRSQRAHACDPARIAVSQQLGSNTTTNRFLHARIPQLLMERLSYWTGNTNYLVAKRLESPAQENITLFKSGSRANLVITFQYSKEKHCNILLNKQNVRDYGYIERAVGSGKTLLSDEELTNFLQIMEDATFGTITIHYDNENDVIDKESKIPLQQQSQESYFLYVTPYSAVDDVWEGWRHDSLADLLASLKPADFLATRTKNIGEPRYRL
jgi:hypothetical protein